MNPVKLKKEALPFLLVLRTRNNTCLLMCKHFEGPNPFPICVPQRPEQAPNSSEVLNSNLLYLGLLLEFVMVT